MSETNVLRMENVTMQFGGVVAVNDLSLDVPEGQIVALIGPNGAGKTTAFNCITGVYQPTNGRVEFMGKTMIRNHPTGKMKKNYLGTNGEKYANEETMELLKEQGLEQYKDEIATSLPYGLQRRLEIARALATDPKLLLLDEPAAGMNPQETQELAEYIKEIRDRHHLTVFLIEHHMDLVMKISDYIYVIDFGSEIARGVPKEVQQNKRVIEAYLGVTEDA